jgi:hypothetical protein
MPIKNISLVIIIVGANLAIIASRGEVVYDALAMFLIGYSAISLRFGGVGRSETETDNSFSAFSRDAGNTVRRSTLPVLSLLVSTAMIVQPFSWSRLGNVLMAALAIQLLALLLLECAYRSRTTSITATALMIILVMWSAHICSASIAGYTLNDTTLSIAETWTVVFDSSSRTLLCLVLVNGILAALLFIKPKRLQQLERPRPWLFT